MENRDIKFDMFWILLASSRLPWAFSAREEQTEKGKKGGSIIISYWMQDGSVTQMIEQGEGDRASADWNLILLLSTEIG